MVRIGPSLTVADSEAWAGFPVMRKFFCNLAVAVSTVLVMNQHAEAAGHHRHHAAPKATAHAALRSGSYRYPQQDDVVLDGWIIGRDPDPSVRSEILRDSVGGGPG